ncbi:CaiB/BaiF CoA-transferase family protein [Salinirubellus sp. GCM10025818]|uniref:CaiB/BaiF CoA transferase family protein n=1 Tax=Salinirubellus TaxID=2162630 RepID=UPI0030CDB29E
MEERSQPLSDATVLELGHIVAGPFCSLLLADLGAEVYKIERPGQGDSLRGSSPNGSSTFNYVNRNKKSITVNLKDNDGRAVFNDLVREADIIVENYSPGTVDELGVGYEQVKEINDGIVYCSIKGFNSGPYDDRPALDPVAEALSGLMSTTGYPDHPPARCGTSIGDMVASFNGALAIVGAIRQRDRTGEGQHITSPMFEGTVGLMGGQIAFSETYGDPAPTYGGGGQSQWAPYDVFETEDGAWVFVGPSSEKHWNALCGALGRQDLASDDRFETLADRRANSEALGDILSSELQEYTQVEIIELLAGADVPVAPVNNTAEVPDDPHLGATGALGEINTAEGKEDTIRVPGTPVRSTGYESTNPEDPPGLGEDTDAVLASIGYSETEIQQLHDKNAI